MKDKLLLSLQKSDQLLLNNQKYQAIVSELFLFFVQNDRISQDITSEIFLTKEVLSRQKRAVVTSKSACIVAGIDEIVYLLKKHTKLTPTRFANDGTRVAVGEAVLEFEGGVSSILSYERTILNILQRMSGIATETERYVTLVRKLKLKHDLLIAATRKTPWMHLDKKAVVLGGGVTHRLDLSDGIMLKDNHLAVLQQEFYLKTEAEAVVYALEHATTNSYKMPIEVEVKTESAALAAVEVWRRLERKNPFILLLDNFTPVRTRRMIQMLRHSEILPKNLSKKEILRSAQDDKENKNIFFEASGGINLENVSEWAKTGVDVISIGALTHSPKAVDLSLDIL